MIGIRKSLHKIKAETNRILQEAREQKDKFPLIYFLGAINWGNLKCVGTKHCLNETGKETYTVLIEEASPNNPDFQEFVEKQLAKRLNLSKDAFDCKTQW